MKHLTPKQKLIVCLSLLAIVFSCAACGTQAEEGSIYVATSNDAEVVTVENMTRVVRGDVIEGTVAYAERETFFEISQGSAGSETILLTEVFHNGEGVSFDGSYDFIKDNLRTQAGKSSRRELPNGSLRLRPCARAIGLRLKTSRNCATRGSCYCSKLPE
jgi:hypothetical protein